MAHSLFPDTQKSLIQALGRSCSDDPGGWQQAWAQFFLLYHPIILGWCRRRGGPNADDLTQDVLLHLVRKINTYNPKKGRFRGWLRVLVRNAALTAYSRQARHALPLETADLATVPDDAVADLDEELAKARRLNPDLAHHLKQVQQRVLPHNWKAFWEYKVEGRSVVDVANELGISVQAVCGASKRICLMLQKRMGRPAAPGEEQAS